MVSLLNLPLLLAESFFLAQGQTPAAPAAPAAPVLPSPSSAEVELLKTQIDFLKTANDGLAASFAQYVNTMNLSLAIAGVAFTAITILGALLFGQNLWEFRRTLAGVNKEVEEKVQQRVQQEVSLVVRNRVDRLESLLAREDLPGRMRIDYVLPVAREQAQSAELKLSLRVLEQRGFQVFPKFLPQLQGDDAAAGLADFTGDIVVLDLRNAATAESEVDPTISRAISKVPGRSAALVAYLPGRSLLLPKLIAQGRYCIAANAPLTLVARVLDAAYVIDAIKV